MKQTIELLEVSKTDTEREIEVVEMELKNIEDGRLNQDIKAEFSKRLGNELIWLESILEDEKSSIEYLEMGYRDEQTDNEIEELKLNREN